MPKLQPLTELLSPTIIKNDDYKIEDKSLISENQKDLIKILKLYIESENKINEILNTLSHEEKNTIIQCALQNNKDLPLLLSEKFSEYNEWIVQAWTTYVKSSVERLSDEFIIPTNWNASDIDHRITYPRKALDRITAKKIITENLLIKDLVARYECLVSFIFEDNDITKTHDKYIENPHGIKDVTNQYRNMIAQTTETT